MRCPTIGLTLKLHYIPAITRWIVKLGNTIAQLYNLITLLNTLQNRHAGMPILKCLPIGQKASLARLWSNPTVSVKYSYPKHVKENPSKKFNIT